jgi:hypothetical protein
MYGFPRYLSPRFPQFYRLLLDIQIIQALSLSSHTKEKLIRIICAELSVRGKKFVKKTLRYVTGLTFIVLGLIGCFLPILQGILFLLIGIIILSSEVPAARKLLSIFRRKYPWIFKKADDFMKGNADKNTTNGK